VTTRRRRTDEQLVGNSERKEEARSCGGRWNVSRVPSKKSRPGISEGAVLKGPSNEGNSGAIPLSANIERSIRERIALERISAHFGGVKGSMGKPHRPRSVPLPCAQVFGKKTRPELRKRKLSGPHR